MSPNSRILLWYALALTASLTTLNIGIAANSKMTAAAGPGSPVQAPTQAPKAPAPQVITKTVLVPQVTYKTVTVQDVVCRPEVHQQTVTVCKLVPETQMTTCRATVMVPERRSQTVSYTDCRLEFENVSRDVTVMVPQMETRQAVRTVCKPVAVQETQTVCKDQGHWETKSYVDRFGCVQTCPVWIPRVVTEEVPVTVYKPQFVEEPYTYEAVICRPETRQITERVAKPVWETKTREVSCVVGIPKVIERQVPQTTFRPVVENKVVNFTKMVPVQVQRQVTVPVCVLVPRIVTVPSCLPVPKGHTDGHK
jgi:hypothetical protein